MRLLSGRKHTFVEHLLCARHRARLSDCSQFVYLDRKGVALTWEAQLLEQKSILSQLENGPLFLKPKYEEKGEAGWVSTSEGTELELKGCENPLTTRVFKIMNLVQVFSALSVCQALCWLL